MQVDRTNGAHAHTHRTAHKPSRTHTCIRPPTHARTPQAVTRGAWVVIEDVDLAPFEVLSALVPLLEERRLYILPFAWLNS